MIVESQLSEEDAALLQRAETWKGGLAALSSAAGVSHEERIEIATAMIYLQLSRLPANADFLLHEHTSIPSGSLIGVVPGAFYQEHGDTGADGARLLEIAKKLGIEAKLLPLANFGTLQENAKAILTWLQTHSHRRITLISLSKGGADVKYALSSPGAAEAFAAVQTWVNFSGIVQGTPLVAWLRRRPLRWCGIRFLLWWKGHGIQTLEELQHGHAAPLNSWPELPSHLRILHIYGFPLRRHLTHRWALRAYDRLAPLGPNDGGGNLLTDLPDFPGIICPIWGTDHYLSPAWDLVPTLTTLVASAMAERRHATASATNPSAPPATRSNR